LVASELKHYDYYRIRYGIEHRCSTLMSRLRAYSSKLTGAHIGNNCSFGKKVSFVYGWRTSIGAKCVIDDFVQFKTPTCNSQNKRFNICLNDNVFIGRGTIIDSNLSVIIGRDVLIAPYCFITDTEHEFDDKTKPIFAQGWKYKPVIIEDDVWIGAHCVILSGVTIGKGCVIAANSTVLRDIPQGMVVGGNPAEIIRERRKP
jgi:acetyltransferase-like isoleucine patch superfamily enzyme